MTFRDEIPKDIVMPDDDDEVVVDPLESPENPLAWNPVIVFLASVVGVVLVFGGFVMWDDLKFKLTAPPPEQVSAPKPPAPISQQPSSKPEYRSPSSRVYTGVKLFLGNERDGYTHTATILGGGKRNGERMVLIRYVDSGSVEWKTRKSITDGWWSIKSDDPAITQGAWKVFQ